MSEQKNFYFDGLLRDCGACQKERKALSEFNRQMQGCSVVGTELDEEGETILDRKNVVVYGPFRLNCTQCHNTGLQLTKKGMRLMGVLEVFKKDAHPQWVEITDKEIEAEQEIPF